MVVLEVAAHSLDYVLKLALLGQVCARIHELRQEGHSFENVGELNRALALIHIQEVRQNHTFSENAFYLVEHLVTFLLDLGVALRHAAVCETHADGPNLVDH